MHGTAGVLPGDGAQSRREVETGDVKVQRQLVDLRREGQIPFTSIADNTRWQRKPITYDSLTEAVERTAATYRRAVWSDLDLYAEVWLEKDEAARGLERVVLDELRQLHRQRRLRCIDQTDHVHVIFTDPSALGRILMTTAENPIDAFQTAMAQHEIALHMAALTLWSRR